MYKLCVRLPPFSPDYSGVCSALFELGGLLVIHDASGCTGNYTGYDEPRWYGSSSMVYCSSLRELDAVMGDDEKLVKKIAQAAKDLNPRFIAVLGSPVPMVIGTDLPGLAAEVEYTTQIPSFGFSTTGLTYYDKGAGDAFLMLAKHFIRPNQQKRKNAINLLGATPLDFSTNGDVLAFRQMFEQAGYEVLCDFAMHSSLSDIENSAQASANIVLSSSGMSLANWFARNCQIPYITGVPTGAYAQVLLDELERCLNEQPPTRTPQPKASGKILLIHDQIIGNSIRAGLELGYGITGVDVCTPFGFYEALAASGDQHLGSELQIMEAVNSGYQAVIADPLIGELIKDTSKTAFIPLAHVAVSSKLYWDRTPKLAGNLEFLASGLGALV